MSQVYPPTPAAPPNNRTATNSLISGGVGWALWVLFLCFNWTIGMAFGIITAGITSVLCGIASFLPIVPWIAAVIMGHQGMSQIERTGEGGRSLAIAGLIMGYLGILITLCTIVFYVLGFLGIAVASFLPPGTFSTPVPFPTP